MKTTSSFKKSTSQIKLELILHFLKEKGITVSQLKSHPEYATLDQELKDALTEIINVLVHEKSLHELITSIARSYPSQYYKDLKEYDTLFEVVSETYLGLYNTITKSAGDINNTGRVRIDTYLDKEPELFTYILRKYIRNNIVLDIAKTHCAEVKHIESDTAFFGNEDENDSCSKLDSVIYNKNNIEDSISYTEDIIRRVSYKPDTCFTLINAVITRFMSRKPVAGYIYLCIINESYDPLTVLSNLKTKDFNHLFHTVLYELELNYDIDLSCYDNVVFDASKYLSSFRCVDDAHARSRIDRLASQTRTDVQKIQAFIDAKSEYIDVNDKYFCL